MRTTTKTKFVKISVTEDIHNRLKRDRDLFQEKVNGVKWSISDTINHYLIQLDEINNAEQQNIEKQNIEQKGDTQ